MDFQFFPTPVAMGRRLWAKFKNKDFSRVLEPEAGNGDLAEANPLNMDYHRSHRGNIPIDCIELDLAKHAVLREKGFNVIGMDFLQFGDGAIYSHIVMNPPFADGDKHVLKAWDILWDGEIAAILNAETIRNPYSKDRQQLVRLIEQHGEVEFVEGAFSVQEAERKTDVEVALVYLRKVADVQSEILGDLLDDLKPDHANEATMTRDFEPQQDLALPNSVVETSVATFNAAIRTTKEAVYAEAKARYYVGLLGETMAVRNAEEGPNKQDFTVNFVKKEIAKRYGDRKDRAWTSILRSANVTSRLSSKAQKRVESEFESIKKLEFTIGNIYGFLLGIVESQGQIQLDMVCDVFDQITRYHSDNTVFYRGWKSNDRHRTCGMRIKTTRFILPGNKTESYQNGLDYDAERQLADFDKVFAMMDGKAEPEVGLQDIFRTEFGRLKHGGRVSSSYFDVRYYPGIGTIHFFPLDQKLMDRFNRTVGKQRTWLPPGDAESNADFKAQYDKAEKFDKELRAEVKKSNPRCWGGDPFWALFTAREDEKAQCETLIDAAAARVQERHGINIDSQTPIQTSSNSCWRPAEAKNYPRTKPQGRRRGFLFLGPNETCARHAAHASAHPLRIIFAVMLQYAGQVRLEDTRVKRLVVTRRYRERANFSDGVVGF